MDNLSHKRKILIVLVAALMVGGGIISIVSYQPQGNIVTAPVVHKAPVVSPLVSPYITVSVNPDPAYVLTNITISVKAFNFSPINYEFRRPNGTTCVTDSSYLQMSVRTVGKDVFAVTATNEAGSQICNYTYANLVNRPYVVIKSDTPRVIDYPGKPVSAEFISCAIPSFDGSFGPGIPPYTYNWTVNGKEAGSTGTDLNYTFDSIGVYNITVEWTDSVGGVQYHFYDISSYNETVDPPLKAAISSNKNPSDIGQTVTFQAIPSGSTGSYTSYSYKLYDSDSNLSSVLYSGTTSSFSAILDSAGTFLVTYEVESSNGYYQNATLSQQVNSDPSVAISANKTTTDVGNPISLSVSPSGGTSPYSYTWFCSPNGTSLYFQFATGSNPSLKFSKQGTYYVIARLTDSAGFSVNSTTLVITVNPAFSISISSSVGHKAIISEYGKISVNCIGGSGQANPNQPAICIAISPGGTGAGYSAYCNFEHLGVTQVRARAFDAARSYAEAYYYITVYPNNIGISFQSHKYEPVGVLVNLNASVYATFSPPSISQFSYTWTINGVNHSGNNYLYDFSTPGTYNITLTIDAVASSNGYPFGAPSPISEENKTYATVIASSPGNSSNIIINSKQAAISGGESFSWYTSFKNSSEYSYYLLIQGDGTGPSQVKTLSNGTLYIEENVYYSNYAPGTYSITLIVYNNRSQSNQSTMGFSVSLSQSNQVTLNTVIEWFGGLTNFIVVIGTIIGIGGTVWAIHANENPNVIIESGTGNKTKQVLLKGKKIRGKK